MFLIAYYFLGGGNLFICVPSSRHIALPYSNFCRSLCAKLNCSEVEFLVSKFFILAVKFTILGEGGKIPAYTVSCCNICTLLPGVEAFHTQGSVEAALVVSKDCWQ